MSTSQSYEKLIGKAEELFHHTDEPIYSILVDYPKPYPIRYIPYGLGDAAFEAMIEIDPTILRGDLLELIRTRQLIEENLKEIIPEWRQIYRARFMGAAILNNYGGPGVPFSPN